MALILNPAVTYFIYRPGASNGTRWDSGVPIYDDWDDLVGDLGSTPGSRAVLFDHTQDGGFICTIPTGTHSLANTALIGLGTLVANSLIPAVARVDFDSGAILQAVKSIRGLQFVDNRSATRVFDVTSRLVLQDCEILSNGITAPYFRAINPGSTIQLFNTRMGDSGTDAPIEVTGSGNLALYLTGRSSLTAAQLSGSVGTITVDYTGDSTEVNSFQPGYSGTLTFLRNGVDLTQSQTVYLSKIGSTTNGGLHPDEPVSTLSTALTAASALSPTTSNRVVIMVMDAGTYARTSTTTLPDYVSLQAPHATITSTTAGINMGVESRLNVHRLVCAGAAITHSPAGNCWIRADYIESQGGFSAIQSTSSTGQMFLDIGDVVVDTGSGLSLSSGVITGDVGCIDMGGVGNGANLLGTASASLQIGRISGTGVGLRCQTGTHDITVTSLLATTAYNVSFGATLNVVATRVTGSTVNAGTLNEVKAV
jgi:hypothetical protein